LEKLLTETHKENLKIKYKMMLRNSRQLLRMINQLLDFSKLEAGGLSLKVRCQDIIPLLRGIVFSFMSLAERKRITLKFEAEQKPLFAYIDRDKIENIMSNLLSNAFKFTREGGKISVLVADTAGNEQLPLATGNCVEIIVADSGVGIPPEHLGRIFDRFFQVDGSHTREQQGSGIGLALTKELVELHHGEISVNSEPGRGTTFTIRLPQGKKHWQENEMISEEVVGEENQHPFSPVIEEIMETDRLIDETDHTKDKGSAIEEDATIILVVEDNRDVRTYIHEHLSPSYQLLEAGDGTEGIEKAREVIPDLIISDIMMPIMDGYELCRILKNDEKTSHIPVILLTAKASSESKLQGLETGADDYLIKPFDSKELLVRVKNLIALRQKLRERFSREVVLKPGDIAITPMDEVFLQRVQSVVEQHLDEEEFSVEILGQEVGMSRTQIHRKLRALIDQSASQFVRSMRLQRAVDLLNQKAGTVAEIAYMVGFNSQAYFTKCFHEQFGCSPKEFSSR
jgi:DNA-binding response OmpR family regulator/two-component sensor histidine kinase